MTFLETITILFNGLALSLAIGFVFITLWYDARKPFNQFFSAFLFTVIIWNSGSLLAQILALIRTGVSASTVRLAASALELGFTGSGIALLAFMTVIVGAQIRHRRFLLLSGFMVLAVIQLFLTFAETTFDITTTRDALEYEFQPTSPILYLVFNGATLYLIWKNYRSIRPRELMLATVLFILGQGIGVFYTNSQALLLSIDISSAAMLVMSFAFVRHEILIPLSERASEVETMHRVTLVISSQIAIDRLLNEIAHQAAGLLRANAVGIFLNHGDELELAAVHNLPDEWLQTHLSLRQGLVGQVATSQQSVQLDNYARDWEGRPDLPLAPKIFGSVIGVPLIYGGSVIGVLLIAGHKQGAIFQPDDARRAQLLGAQAAVAIAHSRLFAEQRALMGQVEAARSQLETVLSSTDNPVIAVDRKLRLIFANPAARLLFSITDERITEPILEFVPESALPPNYRRAVIDVRKNRVHTYEMNVEERVYLCHLAALGRTRIDGWVAVFNDVTQYKELDRMKSEMIRMTSHDLKNPLQAAIANMELLMEDMQETHPEQIQESAIIVEKQLERMNRIINGILDLERVQAGMAALEICQPELLVAQVVEEIQHLADEHQITLIVEVESDTPAFMGDPEQFERALVNLLENAIKFTQKGGRVSLSVRPDVTSNRITFQVNDSGIGIPKEMQSRIFERFFRGGQKGTEHVSGTGLGLSLVKTIIDNHQGKISVESGEGRGTTFSISMEAVQPSIVNKS